ncbi:MAG TPA: DUF2785 domain-containing protein [Nocardioidaceae bacterium]|nr:DUF2785 domain-containing protein [Nocardioidaceae bacterium]
MESAFWDRVVAEGHKVPRDPQDPPLADLTAELTTMLGDPDPYRRDEVAYPTLATWVEDGVYDQLLEGLGDGMTEGLLVGLGESGTDTVFRRSFSALVLAECIGRDQAEHLLAPETTLRWGDRVAGWLVRERDLRGFVSGKGWAHAVAHGADAIRALAGSESIGRLELTVLLDVIADRLLVPTEHAFAHGEDDRLAMATMSILRRDMVDLAVLEPWLSRLVGAATPVPGGHPVDGPADVVARNVTAYLRALHLQVALAPNPPACRADLLLALIDRLRELHPGMLGR